MQQNNCERVIREPVQVWAIRTRPLDTSELRALTGYKIGSAQARWVRENLKLEPLLGADGHPRLTWTIIEQAALARSIGGRPLTAAALGAPLPFTPNWKKAA